MSKVTASQQGAWSEIVTKKYSDQAIWFLNGFWEELESQAENVWKWVELFAELDQDKKGDGCELDEFWSHKFLESLGKTMTVIEMREKFRTIDVDFNKRMSLIEFLSYQFKKSIQQVIDAPQGDNQQEIEAAQAAVEAAQKAVDEMVERLAEAKSTAEAAEAAEEAASKKEAESNARAAEAQAASDAAEAAAAPYRAAVAENEKALEELHKQEEAYKQKKESLEKTKNDMSIGVVRRNKAANELDQLLSEDPLPLRKAKINQEATVRKMEKAAKPFNEASAKAKAAAEVAEAAAAEATAAANHARAERDKAEAAKEQAEAAVKEAESMLQAAIDTLEEAKKKGGVAHGAIWWMERSIEEKKKYMPGYKGPRK